jgi:hypothetical protein
VLRYPLIEAHIQRLLAHTAPAAERERTASAKPGSSHTLTRSKSQLVSAHAVATGLDSSLASSFNTTSDGTVIDSWRWAEQDQSFADQTVKHTATHPAELLQTVRPLASTVRPVRGSSDPVVRSPGAGTCAHACFPTHTSTIDTLT